MWTAIKGQGFEVEVFKRNVFNKEKGVDMKMGLDIGKLIYKGEATPNTLIIVAGDADFIPAVEVDQVEGWRVEIWYWRQAAGALKNAADHYVCLDDRVFDIGFTK